MADFLHEQFPSRHCLIGNNVIPISFQLSDFLKQNLALQRIIRRSDVLKESSDGLVLSLILEYFPVLEPWKILSIQEVDKALSDN